MTLKKSDYDDEPVFYCANCLSLKIRGVGSILNSEYCDECGSTNIGLINIRFWENLYQLRYGHKFLDSNFNNNL